MYRSGPVRSGPNWFRYTSFRFSSFRSSAGPPVKLVWTSAPPFAWNETVLFRSIPHLVGLDPVRSGPVLAGLLQSCPAWSSLVQISYIELVHSRPKRYIQLWSVRPGPVRSGPVRSRPVRAGPVSSGPVWSGPVRSGPVQSSPVQSSPNIPTFRMKLVCSMPRSVQSGLVRFVVLAILVLRRPVCSEVLFPASPLRSLYTYTIMNIIMLHLN